MADVVQALSEVLPKQSEVLQWGCAGAVVLPFLFLISHTLERLIQSITAGLLRRQVDEMVGQTQLVRNTLQFLLGWVAAVFVLAVGSPY